ncbi:hypothetical protein H2198_003776 [Neophaeococcomyces mojaviensis]|uniref:Uncharacterized protein n=1 Tax=Neophaeococcomyces mojaviensis TaxID=3383035 RepID=A0ACC3AAJ8_9EURO|nr:hypothetical protein H2198_003776 [Knufia sp. JES_112]
MSAVIYVSYPRTEDSTFDIDYYLNTHMKIVQQHWGPHGLKSWNVIQFEEGDPSGMHVQCIMYWESKEAFTKAYALGIPEVHQDLKHYSNTPPVRWVGKNLLQG